MAMRGEALTMAMGKCRECGSDVSTEAEKCLKCGVRNPVPTPWFRKPVYVLVALATLGISFKACSPESERAATTQSTPTQITAVASPAPPPPPKTKEEFEKARPVMMTQLREALRTKSYYDSLNLGEDWKLVADEEFIKLWGQVIDADRKQSEAASAKLEKQRKADARKRGVSIGMTQQEVIESSWGKPQSINRTMSRYGEREQWVYGGRNYLYFENGKLTTIQN
jgi:type IV secretory pathway VirB10-like protein